eukprot:m51a1_g2402 hypothetical protein (206) ;mRNA; f:765464-766349
MDHQYNDPDDVLSDETMVPVTFNRECSRLGFIGNSSHGTSDVAPGTRMQVPLWLASALAANGIVTIHQPAHYGARLRGMLTADPCALDLGTVPYFYEVGSRLAELTADSELGRILVTSILSRSKRILDRSQNARDEDPSDYTATLTSTERALFGSSYQGAREYDAWRAREPLRIARSSLIPQSANKRPLEESGASSEAPSKQQRR